jgi:hypothetical protein
MVVALTVSLVTAFALWILLLLAVAVAIAMVGVVLQAWWWTMAQLSQAARWSRVAWREVLKIGSKNHPFDEPELPKPARFPFVLEEEPASKVPGSHGPA